MFCILSSNYNKSNDIFCHAYNWRVRREHVVNKKKWQWLSLGIGIALLAGLLFMQSGSAKAASNTATWNLVASPNPAPITNILNGLTVLSSDNAWAVGSALDTQQGNKTLIEHWDGKHWNVVASPTPNILATHAGHLTSVAATGANDVWAVGEYVDGSDGGTHTLIEHWNGKQWSIVSSPSPGSFSNILTAITALSSNNIWATGNYRETKDGSSKALIIHWNGKEWDIDATLAPANFSNTLNGITALSPDNIWAVGTMVDRYRNGSENHVLIEHWNGDDWHLIPGARLPRGASGASLRSVSTVPGSKLIWAVGSYYQGDESHLSTLTEVWDGDHWRAVDSPNRSDLDNLLMSVTATSPYDIWAVGGTSQNGPGQSLIEHWNGSRWTIIPHLDPGPRTTMHFLASVAHSPDRKSIWGIGFYGDGTKIATLAERYA